MDCKSWFNIGAKRPRSEPLQDRIWCKTVRDPRLTDENDIIRALCRHPFILKTQGYSRETEDFYTTESWDIPWYHSLLHVAKEPRRQTTHYVQFHLSYESSKWFESDKYLPFHDEEKQPTNGRILMRYFNTAVELRADLQIRKTVRALYRRRLFDFNTWNGLNSHPDIQKTWEDSLQAKTSRQHDGHDTQTVFLSLRIDREWYSLCLKRHCTCALARRYVEITKVEIRPILFEITPLCESVVNFILKFV